MTRFKRVNTKERRASRRVPASEAIPHGSTRLASGQEVKLVNIGFNGTILVNSKKMLLPGSTVRLRLIMPGASMNLDGRIRRCRVTCLKQQKIQYEAAIILDGGFPPLLVDMLHQRYEVNSQEEPYSLQEINSGVTIVSEAAQIWVLDAVEANG